MDIHPLSSPMFNKMAKELHVRPEAQVMLAALAPAGGT